MVNPDVVLCAHKQSKVGDTEHIDLGKLSSTKTVKHHCAQRGMNFAISYSKVYPGEEDWAIAWFAIERVYIKASKLAGKTPILRRL